MKPKSTTEGWEERREFTDLVANFNEPIGSRAWNIRQDQVFKDFQKYISFKIKRAKREVLKRILTLRTKTFQPFGGLSNIEYIPKFEIETLLKELEEKG